MIELISTYWTNYLVVHFIFAGTGLAIDLLNTRYLKVSDFVWATIFGPLYFGHAVWGMDKIVIDLRNKK